MEDAVERYMHDPMFHALTDTLFRLIRDEGYIIQDIAQAAFVARAKVEKEKVTNERERYVPSMLTAYDD